MRWAHSRDGLWRCPSSIYAETALLRDEWCVLSTAPSHDRDAVIDYSSNARRQIGHPTRSTAPEDGRLCGVDVARPCWTPGCRPLARIIERNSRVLCRQLDQEDGTIALAGGRHPRTVATRVQSVCTQPGRGEHTTESDTRGHDRAIALDPDLLSISPSRARRRLERRHRRDKRLLVGPRQDISGLPPLADASSWTAAGSRAAGRGLASRCRRTV